MMLLQQHFLFLSVPSVCQFVHVIDRKASVPARVPINVTHLLGQKSVSVYEVKMSRVLFSYFKRMHQAGLGYQHAEVTLTHQWGSLVDVTTMISSLKKARCSELTALQSTRALTSLWWGLLPETWSIHKSHFMNFIEQRQNRLDITGKTFLCVPLHSCGVVGCSSGQVRMTVQVLELVLEWGYFPLSCSRAPPGCPHCLETVCYICPGCLLRYWSGDMMSSFPNCRNQTEKSQAVKLSTDWTMKCQQITAVLPYLTGPMWFWAIQLWEPVCALNRPPWPCGDFGGFPPWPWLSVLGEEEMFLICVCGLEWEGGLEDRLGLGVPSCAVTEIWGSERPVEEKENQSKTEWDKYQVYKILNSR